MRDSTSSIKKIMDLYLFSHLVACLFCMFVRCLRFVDFSRSSEFIFKTEIKAEERKNFQFLRLQTHVKVDFLTFSSLHLFVVDIQEMKFVEEMFAFFFVAQNYIFKVANK